MRCCYWLGRLQVWAVFCRTDLWQRALLPNSLHLATTLKQKREDISPENLIISLDVEEKTRAKDARGISAQGASANIIVNKPTYKGKGKGKMNYGGKPKKTTNFKKNPEKDEKVRACFV